MTYTLRGRLTGATALTVAVALGLGLFLLRAAASELLEEEFRSGLETKARTLGTLLSFDSRGIQFDFAGELMPEYTSGHSDEYFQLWGPGGQLLELSENLDEPVFERRGETEGVAVSWNQALPDGRMGACVSLILRVDRLPGSDTPIDAPQPLAQLVLAQERETLQAQLTALTESTLIACLVALAATVLAMRFVLLRGFQPLVRMADEMSRIGRAQGLSEVTEIGLPQELEVCASKVNELVGRLSQAAEEQKRVANGLAHELRTPIATLRSATDLLKYWPEDEELKAKTLRIARDVANNLSRTISALLRFGRLREGEALVLRPVQLVGLVREVAGRFETQVRDKGLTVQDESNLPVAFTIITDEEILGMALSNLLENAIHHAPVKGKVVHRTDLHANATVSIGVSNRAPELDEADLALLCEPFWQKDPSRSDAQHAGLGLSLVVALVEALGGRLELRLDDGWFHATLILPAAPPEEQAAVR